MLKRRLQIGASLLGIDARRFYAMRRFPRFIRDLWDYRRQEGTGGFTLSLSRLYPVLTDMDMQAGVASGHYFHQDLWAARKINVRRPSTHVDVGSRLDGFVAHVLSFMPVTVVDVRELRSNVEGLNFIRGDASDLNCLETGSIESLSSLHAVEHFGLGRYGDRIDPLACFKAMNELARILRPDGRLYFSVPVGRQRLEFNAHRVFAPRTVLSTFRSLTLISFAAIDDAGAFHPAVSPDDLEAAEYSCGLFEFTKNR